MKYFLKRITKKSFGSFGGTTTVEWLRKIVVTCWFEPFNRTAFSKKELDALRVMHDYTNNKHETAHMTIEVTYEEVPAKGLHESFTDDSGAYKIMKDAQSTGKKGGEE